MARKTLIQLTDDIDGTPIADGTGHTVTFAVDGIAYEIDLSDAHLAELHQALTPYTTAGRRTGRKSNGTAGATKTDKAELAKIREWARQNGHDVSDRGRVSAALRDAYDAANRSWISSPKPVSGDPNSTLATRHAPNEAEQLSFCRTRRATTRSVALHQDPRSDLPRATRGNPNATRTKAT
jgi:hypothetical protein